MTTFKLADVQRITGATASQLDYWMRLGIIVPYKDATSSGDHRLFSMVNVIEVATALRLSELGMSTDRIKLVAAMQRKTLDYVRPEHHAKQLLLQYVEMVVAGATLMGLTEDAWFKKWEREVARVVRRLKKTRTVVPDVDLLAQLAAQRAAFGGERQERP